MSKALPAVVTSPLLSVAGSERQGEEGRPVDFGQLKGGVAAALALWAVAVTLWVVGRHAPVASARGQK
jgi:hypothetical protein